VNSWWLLFILGTGLLAVGVLMIIFRVQFAKFNDLLMNEQWGFFLKTPIKSSPALSMIVACFPVLAGLSCILIALLNL
jgi:hypothetical protein